MQLRTLLAIASLTVAATACGSDSKTTTGPGDGNGGNNSYSASITGDITKSIEGNAAFAPDNQDPDVGFGMALADGEEGIVLWRKAAGVLASGQHTVANYNEFEDADIPANQIAIAVFLDNGGGLPVYCASTGGTVTVSSSSASRLRGTFQFTAACVDPASEEESAVTISGTFDATGGSVVIPG